MADASTNDFLRQLVDHAGDLYTLPTVALEVVRLADRPDVDTRALRQCIENDPALTAKILKVVNSSLFGPGRKVGDLSQAIGRLGVKPLKLLALGFSLPKELVAGHENRVLAEYWRRSLLKAAAAREICRCWWSADGDDAFIAGLLQDVGSLVLLKTLGFPYEEMLAEAYARGEDPRHRELAAFGFERTAVSAALLSRWGLPHELTSAIATPLVEAGGPQIPSGRPANDFQRLVVALRLAGLFADVLTGSDKTRLARLLGESAQAGSVRWDQIESLASGLQRATAQLTDILSLPKADEIDYAQVLEKAHQQLAGLAAEAAADLAHERASADRMSADRTCAVQTGGDSPAADRLAADRLADAVRAWPAKRCSQAADSSPPLHTRSDPRSGDSAAASSAGDRLGAADGAAARTGKAAQAVCHYSADGVLLDRASTAVESCRRSRAPLSLALVAIDDFDRLLLSRGPQGARQVMRMVEAALDAASDSRGGRLQLDERCCAVLLPECDKSLALEVARQAMQGVERWSSSQGDDLVTLSAGLATLPAPSKGFPVRELVSAAARCLQSAQRSGGRSCKSIDIF